MLEITRELDKAVDALTSYAPVHIFDSQTPSAKEKKAEKAACDVADIFYDSNRHTPIYEALSAIKTSLQLGCNEVVLPHLFAEFGTFERLFNEHLSFVQKTSKSNQHLNAYYKDMKKLQLFDLCVQVANHITRFEVDLTPYKANYKLDYRTM